MLYGTNAFIRRLRDRLLKIFRASGKTCINKTLPKYAVKLRALAVTVLTEIQTGSMHRIFKGKCSAIRRLLLSFENRFCLLFCMGVKLGRSH